MNVISEITCPGLKLNTLNSKSLNTYLRTTDEITNGITYLVIDSTNILGDLNIVKEFRTTFSKLQSEAVTKNKTNTVTFRGLKNFNKLRTSKLISQNLNDVEDKEIIFKSRDYKTLNITGKKIINSLRVKQSVNIINGFDVDFINDKSLADAGLSYQTKFTTVYLDKPLVSADLIIDILNGQHFSDVLNFVDDDLNFHTTLIINGNVNFSKSLRVKEINSIHWNEFRSGIIDKSSYDAVQVHGQKSFKNIVEMDFVERLSHINEIRLRDLFKNILLKDRTQIVTGSWSFGKAKFRDIRTAHLNHIQIDTVIDRRENVVINSDFYVEIGNIFRNVQGDFVYDFDSLFQKIKFIDQQYFSVVRVLEHAEWPSHIGNETAIDYLNKYGVRKDAEQVITGKVILVKPLINSAYTTKSIFKDFDFEYIAKDCLYKSSAETQYVTAQTIFTRPIQIDTVKAFSGVETSNINGINILQFNNTTYRKNGEFSAIEGNMKFNLPIIVEHLVLTNGKIDEVSVDNFYCYNSTSVLPPVTISDLQVIDKLSTLSVQYYDFEEFFQKRITKRRKSYDLTGQPFFLSLKVAKNINIKSLNNINIDDIIWKSSKQLQNINGAKKILGDFNIEGPSSIHMLNKQDVIEKAKESVVLANNYDFQVIKHIIFIVFLYELQNAIHLSPLQAILYKIVTIVVN